MLPFHRLSVCSLVAALQSNDAPRDSCAIRAISTVARAVGAQA